MQGITTALTGAICGAIMAVAAVIVLTNAGLMPVNEPQLRGYMLRHPELVTEMTETAQKLEDAKTATAQAATLKKIGMQTFFDPKLAFVTGPAQAKNTLVEFYDYDCPYCRASLPGMKKFYEQHKNDTQFSFVEFPLPVHGPDAQFAARLSLAARRQPDKYVALHFALLGTENAIDQPAALATAKALGFDMAKLQADMKSPEIDAAIAGSRDLAKRAGIDGTPTFIINGVMYPGAMDYDSIAAALKKA